MAQADYFLKIAGVDGESDDKSNPKELQIESWSFGASNSGSSGIGGGAGTGKVSLQDFHFVVQNGKASPNLFLACASGKHIDEAKLTCRKSTGDGGQMPYLIVTFNDIVISSFQTGGSNGSGVLPMEQISFNFTKIKMEIKVQDSKGNLANGPMGGWDTKKNEKV